MWDAAHTLFSAPIRIFAGTGMLRGYFLVFGLLKRGDSIYTAIVTNAGKPRSRRGFAARQASAPWSTSTVGRAYHGLVDLGFDKHLRVEHRDNIFTQQHNQIHGVGSLWSPIKRRLACFCGVLGACFQGPSGENGLPGSTVVTADR